ncbi:ABC transporter ATP-binding protein [Agromyces italicus]|uniref:dipeptide ABC transporter ATP-binding protein n=1 Tax=Agromyces italicus TaxID=279572 RepID=UPI0003B30747|nr:ABC transporter ATP-binding protein [Agromyces italicus]
MTDLLRVRGLSVSLEERRIVDDVDLDIDAGETVGLVGESGSGKSLLARAVAGLLPPSLTTTGSVTMSGTELVDASERLLRTVRGRRVGLLMQDPFTMLNPLKTVGAHITESLPRGLRRRRGEIEKRLAEVGISDPRVASRYPFQLSGGMRQRVAIAAVLAGDPELLIADEPTTALDATIQAEIMQLLRSVQKARGMAVLLITHDLRVAFAICDKVQVMYAGRVLETGLSEDVARNPRHPYTAGLIGALPVLERRISQLVAIPGSVPRAADVTHKCAFADRCPQRRPDCVETRPPLRIVADLHATACLYDVAPAETAPPGDAVEHAQETPALGKPLLTVAELRKDYGQVRALDAVTLTVQPGERVGLIGESGSGKTTLARCVLGLASPDGGRIMLDGLDITYPHRLSASGKRQMRSLVQCVFQDPSTSLNPSMTVGAALAEAAGRVQRAERRSVDELLDLVGLPKKYALLRPNRLSGGEKQRVAIARALAVNPALLICDEPTASLDVSVQAHILELLRTISANAGTALLFVTHDLAVVRQITDRVVVLLHGKVVETGATAAILDEPTHSYTRRLVASVPPAPVTFREERANA